MGNTKITLEPDFHPRAPGIKNQAKEDFYYKEAPKDSVAPSDNI